MRRRDGGDGGRRRGRRRKRGERGKDGERGGARQRERGGVSWDSRLGQPLFAPEIQLLLQFKLTALAEASEFKFKLLARFIMIVIAASESALGVSDTVCLDQSSETISPLGARAPSSTSSTSTVVVGGPMPLALSHHDVYVLRCAVPRPW